MTQNVLVLGGTRFFGKHLVNELLTQGANVTIATRGKTPDSFGPKVTRLIFDREDEDSIRSVLTKETYDVIYDNIAYTSNDIDIFDASCHYRTLYCHKLYVCLSNFP